MSTYSIFSAVCVLLFIFLFIVKKVGFGMIMEKLAVFWFRLACSFAFLYIAHITVDDFDIIVPVNLFSALTITVLGFPGILCVAMLITFQ